MDRRMKTLPPATETFSPNFERSDEGSTYLLRVNLPGFNRKDFNVQVDQTKKLTIKGRGQSGKNNTYVLLDDTYNLPQDSDHKKITGKFDDGCLVLTIPKMVEPILPEVKKPKEIQQEPMKPLPSLDGKKKIEQGEKQEALQVEKMKKIEERGKVAADQNIPQPKTSPPSTPDKKFEEREKVATDQILPQPKTSPSTPEKKFEEREKVATDQILPQPKTSPPTPEKKFEEREKVAAEISHPKASPQIEKKIEEREKVAAEISQTEVSPPNDQENKSDIQDEGSKKKITDHDQDNERKNGLLCKRKFREEGWLDHGMLDSLIERINNNKKVILVAVVALSVGCYVSHKLRSSGK